MTPMPNLESLLERLSHMRRRAGAIEWLTYLSWMIAGLSLAAVILAVGAAIGVPPSAIRVGVVTLIAVFALALIFVALAKTTIWSPRSERLALAVEGRYPELKNRLIASLQLANRARHNPEQYSLALVDLTIHQATQMSGAIDFAAALDRARLRRSARWAGVSVGALLLTVILFPGLAQRSWEAYSHPLADYSAPIPYTLDVQPGSVEVVKFDDFPIRARVSGTDLPREIRIYQRSEGGDWRVMGPFEPVASNISSDGHDGTHEFRHLIPQVKRDFEYYVTAGELTSATYTVQAVDRPRVNGLRLEILPPSYTGLQPSVIDANDGTITAPVGTRVRMRLESNRDLAKAEVVFSDGESTPMQVRGQSASLEFTVDKNRAYQLALVDESGRTNPHPIEYTITAIPDRSPSVEIVLPGHNVDLDDNMAVDIKIVARDDYGFSRAELKARWMSGGQQRAERTLPIPDSRVQGERLERAYFWDLKDWGLMPEDVVHYFVEVADNDAIAGPKTAQSKMFSVRLPSLDEMMAEFENEREAELSAMDRILAGERELASKIEAIRRELAGKEEIDWENQKKLDEVSTRGRELENQLQEIAEKMQEQVAEAQRNKLASLEMLQKMIEAQQLFNEVATPEMREAQKKLQEAMAEMDPREIQEALKNMDVSQEELLKRLDRTIAYLKKLQAEQKVDAAIRQLEEMLKEQEAINERTEQSEKQQLPDVAPSEEGLKSQFDKFASELAAAESTLAAARIAPQEMVQQFCQSAQKSPASSQMQQTAQKMSQKDQKGSQQGGKQCSGSLGALLAEMKKLQEQMNADQQAQMAKQLREALDKVFYLSDEQENVLNTTEDYDPSSLSLRDLAARQEALRQAATNVERQLTEMAKKSTCLSNNASAMMGEAIEQMGGSSQCLSDRRGPMAANSQRDALFGLNQAAQQLADGMKKNSGQCNNPGSCPNPGGGAAGQMGALSQKQGRLNSQMPQGGQGSGSMSQGERELLQRLKGEQQAIQRGVEDLNSNIGSKEPTLGRLDKLAEEMQKVVEDMEKGEVSQETRERQKRIYTRMLDFQHALQRQDFKEERKAQFGQDIRHGSPAELDPSGGLIDEEYERLLTRYQEEGYPKEYEETIKAYFRALVEARGK